MKKANPLMPQIVAHRGASGDAPENTLAAIRLAAQQGASWIEIDVNISRDEIPVLHHDDTIDRCSDATGLVIERTLQELKSCDSGSWFSEQFSGEAVATLDECLALCNELALGINLEIKPTSGWEIPTTRRIIESLQTQTRLPDIVLSSFSHVALQCAAELAPQLPRASLFVIAPPDWRQLTGQVQACNIHLHANSLLHAELVQQCHDAGMGVYCYTVNSTAQAEALFQLGVDGVISNYPARLLGR